MQLKWSRDDREAAYHRTPYLQVIIKTTSLQFYLGAGSCNAASAPRRPLHGVLSSCACIHVRFAAATLLCLLGSCEIATSVF